MATIRYDNTSGSANFTNSSNWHVQTSGSTTLNVGCNESSRHDNEQKSLFHGIKSAFRMSREFDGEYGTDDPPFETAARIAANVAIAYFETTDQEYTREESFEYLRENVVSDRNTVDRILAVFGLAETHLDRGLATNQDLTAGISKAWKQIDEKENHYDGARTALAIAEAYIGEELYDG